MENSKIISSDLQTPLERSLVKQKKIVKIKKKGNKNNYESLLPQLDIKSPKQEESFNFKFESEHFVEKSKWTKIGDIILQSKNPKALAKFCGLKNTKTFSRTQSQCSQHDQVFKNFEKRTKSCDQAEKVQELGNIEMLRKKLRSKKDNIKIKIKKGKTFNQQDEQPIKVVKNGQNNLRDSLKLTAKKSSVSSAIKQYKAYSNTRISIPKTAREAGPNLLKLSIEKDRNDLFDHLERLSDQNRGIVKLKRVVSKLKDAFPANQ